MNTEKSTWNCIEGHCREILAWKLLCGVNLNFQTLFLPNDTLDTVYIRQNALLVLLIDAKFRLYEKGIR